MTACDNIKTKNKICAMVFDMDGTLLDTEKQYIDEYFNIGKERGMDLPQSLPYACMGLPRPMVRQKYKEQYGDDFDFDEFREEMIRRVHLAWDRDGIQLKPGVSEFLEFLKQNNIPCAVATSTSKASAMDMLKKTDILKYFDAVVCGDEIEKGKPNPDIFLKAAEKINIPPQMCGGVEDSRSGIKAVSAAGMTSFFTIDVLKPDNEIYTVSDYVCDNMFKVKEIVQNLI